MATVAEDWRPDILLLAAPGASWPPEVTAEFAVTDVVATSMSISHQLSSDQKGKAHGEKVLADATALANLIDTAMHVPDPQQALSLRSAAKSALGALDQSFAAAAGCSGPVPTELAKMRFASTGKRFRTALGAAFGEVPKPVEK